MTKLNVVLAMVLGLGLQACSSSQQGYLVNYGQTAISWKDFLEISELHRSAFATQTGESIYLFSASTSVAVELSSGEQISSSQDCIQLASDYSGPIPKLDSDQYYNCERQREAAVDAANVRSFSALLSMAERAVRDEGSCVWPGYDRALDLSVRATGSVARIDDERLFFIKLRCAS